MGNFKAATRLSHFSVHAFGARSWDWTVATVSQCASTAFGRPGRYPYRVTGVMCVWAGKWNYVITKLRIAVMAKGAGKVIQTNFPVPALPNDAAHLSRFRKS